MLQRFPSQDLTASEQIRALIEILPEAEWPLAAIRVGCRGRSFAMVKTMLDRTPPWRVRRPEIEQRFVDQVRAELGLA